jgi:hypothetical protein
VEGKHVVTDDLILETDATGTLNTTFFIEEDQIAQRQVFIQIELVIEYHAAGAGAVFHRQVLQGALAAFVADGTIQRVTGKQELDDILTSIEHLFGRGTDHQAITGSLCAGRLQFGKPADTGIAFVIEHNLAGIAIFLDTPHFDQAHAAHANRGHFGMVAEYRDVVPRIRFGGIDQIHPGRDFIFFVVNINPDSIGHLVGQSPTVITITLLLTLSI